MEEQVGKFMVVLFHCFRYINVGSTALRLILRNFATVIKSNVEAPLHTIGVDVSREER